MFAHFECYSPSLPASVCSPSTALSSICLQFWCLCRLCHTSLSLSLSSFLILALSIYIPISSSPPLPPPLFSWLLNQCLKCVSRVSLAQHLSTATHCLLFQEICVCVYVRSCVCLFPLSPHTNTHPSICPISTCAEAQPPGKLTNESLPQPSVAFLAAFSSFNSSLPSISHWPPPHHTPSSHHAELNSLSLALSLVWLQLMRQNSSFDFGQNMKAQYVVDVCWSQPWFDSNADTQSSRGVKSPLV